MEFSEFLARRQFGLSEGSMYERLRRDPTVKFDPYIYHGGLIYNDAYAAVLERVHREYLDVGKREDLVMFALTDTWRTSQERIDLSAFRGKPVNQDNVRFVRKIVDSYHDRPPVFIGGQSGPRGDAYTPAEAPGTEEAIGFHSPQINALAEGGADFLYAATLPALPEAIGIARVMAETGLPYVLSFVIRRDGTLLDGAPLGDAMARIEDEVRRPPSGFAVNCVYPTILSDGLAALERQRPGYAKRIVSFQSNTSARDPEDLDGLDELQTEDPDVLAGLMVKAHREFGVPFFGGCCGTDTSHIVSLAKAAKQVV